MKEGELRSQRRKFKAVDSYHLLGLVVEVEVALGTEEDMASSLDGDRLKDLDPVHAGNPLLALLDDDGQEVWGSGAVGCGLPRDTIQLPPDHLAEGEADFVDNSTSPLVEQLRDRDQNNVLAGNV